MQNWTISSCNVGRSTPLVSRDGDDCLSIITWPEVRFISAVLYKDSYTFSICKGCFSICPWNRGQDEKCFWAHWLKRSHLPTFIHFWPMLAGRHATIQTVDETFTKFSLVKSTCFSSTNAHCRNLFFCVCQDSHSVAQTFGFIKLTLKLDNFQRQQASKQNNITAGPCTPCSVVIGWAANVRGSVVAHHEQT